MVKGIIKGTDEMKEALLIVDVQNDYFPGGSNELFHPLEAEKRIREPF